MHITDWECHLIETDAAVRLTTRYGTPGKRRGHIVVRLVTDDGSEGLGEASPLPEFTGETPETIKTVLEHHWLPLLVGEDPHHVHRLHEILSNELAANTSALAAVDIALYDLCSRAAGLPLCDYLGSLGADTLPRTCPLGIGDPVTTAAEAKRWVDRGYETVKLKIGRSPTDSRARVGAVRDAVGPDIRIRVDANAALDLAAARQTLKALEPFSLELAEQPLPAWDRQGWGALRESVETPLMADESVHSPRDALELVRDRSVDFLLIKLVKSGGIHRACQIATIAEAVGVHCVVSTPFDTEVAAAAAMHVAFSVGSREHAHDLIPCEAESNRTPGCVHRPRRSGIGVYKVPDTEPSWTGEAAGV